MKIKIKELRELVMRVMSKKYDEEYSSRMADLVMFGEMSGRVSHGLVRLLVGASILSQNPTKKLKSIKSPSFRPWLKATEIRECWSVLWHATK